MDKCFTLKTNMTLVNNTLTILHTYRLSGVLLNTGCPDCLVIYSNNTIGRTAVKALQLLSRRVRVSAAEMKEFTKQAECLNLQPPAIMDLEEGLCPDPTLAPETKTTDVTTDTINSDELSFLEKLLSSESGVKTLFDIIQRSMASFKQD
ncbi:Ras-related protein Rab-7A [Sarotherodon galilaeus]